jgi:hypothetical protein
MGISFGKVVMKIVPENENAVRFDARIRYCANTAVLTIATQCKLSSCDGEQ